MSNFEVCTSQKDDWVGTVRIRLSDHHASSDPPLLMLDIALIAGKRSWGKKHQCSFTWTNTRIYFVRRGVWNCQKTTRKWSQEFLDLSGSSQLLHWMWCFSLAKTRPGSKTDKWVLVKMLSPGLANIIVFRTYAAGILKLCQDDNENSHDVRKVAKCIRKEIKDMSIVKGHYTQRINKISASKHIRSSLNALLRDIWLSKDKLPAVLIGSSPLSSTPLQEAKWSIDWLRNPCKR